MGERERRWLTVVIMAGCMVFACGGTVADPDLWGHTLYGLRALQKGELVERTDPFSYTAAGSAWVNHEWLTELIYGWLWNSYGSVGLWGWRNVTALIVFAVGGFALVHARANLGAVLLLLVFSAECLANFFVFVRPQLVTLALSAISLLALRRFWRNSQDRLVLLLPIVTGLWANLHGGFLAGLGIQLVFFLGAAMRRLRMVGPNRPVVVLAAVLGLSVLATLITPYGLDLHRMLWRHLATEQSVREWQPLWKARQSLTYYLPFVVVLLARPWSKSWSRIDLVVLLVVGIQALCHLRHIALLSVATLVLLPEQLSEGLSATFQTIGNRWGGPHRRTSRVVAVGAVLLLLMTFEIRAVVKMWQNGIRPWDIAVETTRDVPGMPVRVVSWLKHEGIRGNVVTEYGWGQYLIWHLYPHIKVAFDGRYRTVYPDQVEQDYLQLVRMDEDSSERCDLLDNYETDIALFPSSRGPSQYLRSRSDWALVYADEQASLFVRVRPQFANLIERSRDRAVHISEPSAWLPFPGPDDSRQAIGSRRTTVARESPHL